MSCVDMGSISDMIVACLIVFNYIFSIICDKYIEKHGKDKTGKWLEWICISIEIVTIGYIVVVLGGLAVRLMRSIFS